MHKAKCARGHAVTVAVVSYNLSSVTYIVDAIVDDVFVVLLLASFLSPIGRQHQIFMLAFLSLCPYLLLSSLLLLWRVFCFCHCGNLRSMLVLLSLGSVSVIGLFNTCCYLVICVNGRRTRIYRRDAVLLIYPLARNVPRFRASACQRYQPSIKFYHQYQLPYRHHCRRRRHFYINLQSAFGIDIYTCTCGFFCCCCCCCSAASAVVIVVTVYSSSLLMLTYRHRRLRYRQS